MEEKDDNDDDNHNKENARQRHASAEAAGIVRGVSRSIARSIGTSRNLSKTLSKQVPKITKQFFTRRGQLRVSGVAKVSDRISTGWEVYSSVKETVEEGNVPKKKTRNRSWVPVWNTLRTFTATLLRNSLVGAAVFETYVYTISKVASPPGCEEEGKEKGVAKQENESGDNDPLIKMSDGDLVDDDEDDTEETIPLDAPDVFSRASLLAHVGAGALAGSLDGLLSSIWESKSQPNSFQFFLKKARHLVLQQCISHALLFGSYEWCKRSMIHRMRSSQLGEWNIKDSGLSRLGCIAVAGGLAGQLQFLTNHYGEQIQEIQTNKSHIRNQTPRNQLSVNLRLRMRELKHPSMGPMIAAFVPSAVGFVAFEYGKQLGS